MKALGKMKGKDDPKEKKLNPVVEPENLSNLELSLVKAIDDQLVKDKGRGKEWKHTERFTPSSAGNGCPRFMGYRLRGYFQEDDITGRTHRIFDMGNSVEDMLGSYLESLGILVDDQIEVSMTEPFPMYGFCDFLIDWDGEKPVECKSINDAGFVYRNHYHKAKDDHFAQLQWYLYIMGYKEGFVIYVNKNNSEILPILIERDDEWLEKQIAKCDIIYNKHLEGEISVRPYKKTSKNCKYCSAFSYCWNEDTTEGVKISFPRKKNVEGKA